MPVTLRIQNVNTYIEGSFPRFSVDKALSFYVEGFMHAPLFKTCQRCKGKIHPKSGKCRVCGTPRAWDGRKHLLGGGRTGKPYFPTGCLPLVVQILQQEGYQIIFRDERSKCITANPQDAYTVTLIDPDDPTKIRTPWKQQQDSIFAALTFERGVIQVPTSGGKTTIMSAVSKLVPEPVVILINNTTLANQIRNEVQTMLGEEVGLIKGGVFEPRRVTVCMTQSLINLLSLDPKSKKEKLPPLQEAVDLVNRTRVLMLDEAHHGSSNTWFTLCKMFEHAYYRFGLTGTAFMRPSGDDMLLIGATGGLIYEVSEWEMIKEGKIALPIIHLYRIDQPEFQTEELKKLPYQDVYQMGIVENAYLNKLAGQIISNMINIDAQTLVLCERLEHIEKLEYFLKGMDYKVLTGDTDDEERETAKEQFAKGELKCIVATKIFDEGISINNIDVLVRMGLMKTPIKTKQQVGRGQRKKKNKPNVVHVIDFLHVTHRYLAEHSLAHYDMYKKLNYPVILETEPLENLDCPEDFLNGIKSVDSGAGG